MSLNPSTVNFFYLLKKFPNPVVCVGHPAYIEPDWEISFVADYLTKNNCGYTVLFGEQRGLQRSP